MSEPTHTAGQVITRTGATRRQLERWRQAGYVAPATTGTGNGIRCAYGENDVADIAAAVALIREGYRVAAAWARVKKKGGR